MMLNLILAAIQSILQVMVIVFFGFVLTRTGYFTTDKQKWLSRLNMVFFTPCLLFSNIASVISFEQLLAYWPIPVFYICFAGLSFACAHIVARMLRLDAAYRRFVLACVMFSNTNSLPIAVISSLAVSEAGKVLFWDADDTQQAVAARGISYALFYAIFGNLLRWSYGYSLLQLSDSDDMSTVADYSNRDNLPQLEYGTVVNPNHSKHNHHYFSSETLASCSSLSSAASSINSSTNTDTRRTSSVTLEGSNYHQQGDHLTNDNDSIGTPQQQKQRHADESTRLLSSFPTLPSDVEAAVPPDTTGAATNKTNKYIARIRQVIVAVAAHINKYMTPPLYAATLALIVGLIPPFKRLLFDPSSFLYPSLTSAIQSCGKAAVPLILVCLGAQLTDIYQSPSHDDDDDDDDDNNNEQHQVDNKPVFAAIATRMLLMPLLVIPIVLTFVAYGVDQLSARIASDPVFSVMMIILGCTPTAINLVQISQVTGAFENEMLRVLFWSYGVVCVPVFTLIVFLALNIVDKFV
ncbi:membrane transport protein-domain-containing protein [Zychaea mexicana]|uniref:membrane transport protein-domain-containing protein n=1 Tax=Zychaea mexicana TaxID=64656 RepID=UPI0022FE204A|nr:membrane transport protein-domain-containing protein [Zychaea mexicana]KAI9491803.1 membrane transport protein-domain-containing protein [Zychaea mexicana]